MPEVLRKGFMLQLPFIIKLNLLAFILLKRSLFDLSCPESPCDWQESTFQNCLSIRPKVCEKMIYKAHYLVELLGNQIGILNSEKGFQPLSVIREMNPKKSSLLKIVGFTIKGSPGQTGSHHSWSGSLLLIVIKKSHDGLLISQLLRIRAGYNFWFQFRIGNSSNGFKRSKGAFLVRIFGFQTFEIQLYDISEIQIQSRTISDRNPGRIDDIVRGD